MAGNTAIRKSNFELYRIVCILLIVLMHSFGTGEGSLNTHIGILINVLGNIGVTGFILLSGYFGINFKVKKLIKIDIMMIVYSFAALMANAYIPDTSGNTAGLTIAGVIKCLIPFAAHTYWFIAAYFALCILSPFINGYLNGISRQMHRRLIIAAGFIYLFMPTVFFFDQTGDGGKGIVNMMLAYIIGRYIGMYMAGDSAPKAAMSPICTTDFAIFLAVTALNYGLNFAIYHITGSTTYYYARDNSLFTMAQAVLLLLIFARLKISSRIINALSANIIAVYVLEDTLKRVILYLFPRLALLKIGAWYLPSMLAVTIAVFAAASVIEAARKCLFGRLEDMIIDWIGNIWKKQ